MKPSKFKALLMASCLWMVSQPSQATTADKLIVGSMAPNFTLNNQNQKPVSLADYKGHWVVVYFYPKDQTPGCTQEACSFRDNINHLIAQKATILGISVDSENSHATFAKKYKLPFDLLADPSGKVAKQYHALLNLYFFKFAKRHSFIINPQGKIAKIYSDVDPQTHIAILLKDLKTLQHQ